MKDTTLVVNCGSSSLKLAVFDHQYNRLISGLAERLGTVSAYAAITGNKDSIDISGDSTHRGALATLIKRFRERDVLRLPPVAIGHRVVHGGEKFTDAAMITPAVIEAIEACASLAPLHNSVNLTGIHAIGELFPNVPQIAVFDTAFHQSLPEYAYLYALPYKYYEQWGVRRYGFHGTSHSFMLAETARLLNKKLENTSLISAHLGNGCSITAIANGKSVDTSMGLTPLEGLVMGTRSGDIDPGLFDFLAGKGISAEDLHHDLNHKSGLLGLSQQTNDMRTLVASADDGHRLSQVAIDVFCFKLARYIGAMSSSLSTLDALVFTGGIGENSARIRARTVEHLSLLGLVIDSDSNLSHGRLREHHIEHTNSRFPILVIPTNEELVIANAALEGARSAIAPPQSITTGTT